MRCNSHEFEPCGQNHVIQQIVRVADMAQDLGEAGSRSGTTDLACDVHVRTGGQKFHPFVSTSMSKIGLVPPVTSTRINPQSAWNPGTAFATSF